MPYRRLLGTVLGAAEWDSQQPSELRFDIPAGMDIFRENGRVDIVDDELFQDLRKGYANASYDGFPTLHRVTVFIDPFQTAPEETQPTSDEDCCSEGVSVVVVVDLVAPGHSRHRGVWSALEWQH